MYDWEKLTKDALQDLGAESLMVPGAKLREHMVRIGSPAGFDVAGHVAESGTSFPGWWKVSPVSSCKPDQAVTCS